MKLRKLYTCLLALCTIACTNNILEEDINNGQEMVFTAVVEDNQMTKTVLQEDRMSIWWSPSDEIKVFYGESSSGKFVSTNSEPADKATFYGSIDIVTGTLDDENSGHTFWAVYPYDMAKDAYSIELPTEQIAAENTFAPGMFPAVAQSDDTNLSFYNVCGGIVFTVVGEDIKTVTVTGNNEEPIAGTASVSFSSEGVVANYPSETSVTLKAPDDGTFTPGVRYFISIYPTVFENGFTLTFFKAASKSEVVYTKPATIKRSRFLIVQNADSEAGEYVYAVPEEAYKDMDKLYDNFAMNISASSGIYVPTRAMFNYCSDDIYSAGVNHNDHDVLKGLNNFSYGSDHVIVKEMYSRLYNIVHGANEYIEKYQEDLPEIIGEAQVMRAYAHLMLAIGWGTPPLVDHVLDEGEYPSNSVDYTELLMWCAEECEKAALVLEERESPQDVPGAYKITKGFAQALAGKAYLFAGEYEKAKSVLGNVVNSGKYALVSGDRFWENFHVEGDGNEEKVFEPNFEYYSGRQPWSSDGGYVLLSGWMESNMSIWRTDHFVQNPHRTYVGAIQGWNGLGVPDHFARGFLANDGVDSYRFNATLIHIDDVVGGNMYGNYLDDMTKEQKLASTEVGISSSEGLYGQSFWLPFKQMVKETDFNEYVGAPYRWNNFTIMRYAEVLLLYAEACIMTGDTSLALDVINQIQRRAGSQTISTSVDMDVLKREKQYELWFEGCRWPDLVRWGDTELVEKAGQAIPSLFDKFFTRPDITDESLVWENGAEETSRFYTTTSIIPLNPHGFVAGKHNRFPYPASELEANPNLVQNPGW